MTLRLQTVDESNRGDHYHLRADDVCLFLYEYTSRGGWSSSKTNSLIGNLKKNPRSPENLLRYKRQAIAQCSADLTATLNPRWIHEATIVPVPSSKAQGHPDYDDRMLSVARQIPGSNVQPLVRATASLQASHEAAEGERSSVEDLIRVYEVDETLADPRPQQIGILDDVLTAGTHFRAMHTVLSARFPGVPIVGLFVARRVFPEQQVITT